jgi:GntR family transcriptional regulator/MocR family aminotransferase
MRQLYREQRDVLVASERRRLPGFVPVDAPDQGMHLVAYLSGGCADVSVEKAAKQGIVVRALSRMYVAAAPRQ